MSKSQVYTNVRVILTYMYLCRCNIVNNPSSLEDNSGSATPRFYEALTEANEVYRHQ